MRWTTFGPWYALATSPQRCGQMKILTASFVDAAALLGFDLPLDTLALCEALRRRRQETPPTVLVRSSALATLAGDWPLETI